MRTRVITAFCVWVVLAVVMVEWITSPPKPTCYPRETYPPFATVKK